MLETWLSESRLRLPGISQLCFCSLVFVDYVLILYDYQMAFSPICSVVYALGLVRLISRCYAVPRCSMHPNRCLLVPGSPIGDPVRIPLRPCLPCSCLHRALLQVIALFMSRLAPLCAYHPATSAFRLHHVIGLPSSPIILVGFLVTSVVSFVFLTP